ncbi:unnamed protein product [Closterium sp. Naga37s-1]|nr:unnamed protein product [Closterium sp. Naga37s-1]
MGRRGSAFSPHALRLLAVLLIVTAAPFAAVSGRRIMQATSGTTTNANFGTATSVDATAGVSATDLSALAVDAKTRAEIKALAPLMGAADLTGVGKPPERASYLTKDAFAAAARKWLAAVRKRVQKLIQQAAGGGGKGRGTSKGNSAGGNTVGESRAGAQRGVECGGMGPKSLHPPHHQGSRELPNLNTVSRYLTVDRSLGYVPPTTKDLNPAKLPNLNTVSRYLTVGLTLDPISQKVSWDFKRSVNHSKFFPEDDFDQGNCGSCWAYAAARAVQGAYAKLKETDDDVFPSGMSLSVQQLVDCTGSSASCRGGYPEAALQYVAKIGLQDEAGYAYTGASGKCSVNKDLEFFNICMYEQVPLPGPLGLILALQKQPVIVTIRASSQDFIDYAEGIYEGLKCYSPVGEVWADTQGNAFRATATATNNTGLLDHVMLAVGYNYEGPGASNNYFILKNSWGPRWGENGYMRIRMEGDAFGTCGMLVNRGLYPVVNARQTTDPCGTSPCGGGTCEADTSGNGKYTCQCTDLLVPAVNRDGTPTCTIVDICSVLPSNPCVVGQCINSGDGGYSCLCPPNYKTSTLASGQITCVPEMSGSTAAAVQGTYTVQGGETCGAISGFIGLTQEQFLQQNEGVDCDNLKAGQVLNISIPSSAQVCRVRYTVTQADAAARSCDPINTRFGIDVTTINPSLDCSALVPNQQICIQVGDAVSGAADYNLCTEYQPVSQLFTCASAVANYGMTWFDLYRLNPGINCDTLGSLTASEICVAGTPLGAVACGKARSKTVANRRYTVGAGDSCASLVVVQFQRQPPLVGELNRGWMCRSQSLFAGMPLCIPS